MTDIVERFIEMMEQGRAIRERLAREAAWKLEDERITKSFEHLSTNELKAIWDVIDEQPELADIDDLHRALNMRGEGDYCAV